MSSGPDQRADPLRCSAPGCPASVVMVEIPGVYDGGLYWACFEGHHWHRWPPGNYLRDRAEPYVTRGRAHEQ